MSKREKIILGAVAAVAVVAVYIQFLAPSSLARGPDLRTLKQELTSFVTSTSTEMVQAKPSAQALYTIARAQRPWARDPFLASNEPLDIGKADAIAFPRFTYTSFVGQGSRLIAIINGEEYEEGQELDPPGFVLKRIFPNKVIIGVKGKEQETTVAIVEEVQDFEVQDSGAAGSEAHAAIVPALRDRVAPLRATIPAPAMHRPAEKSKTLSLEP
jgi:hypothetical protein